MLLLLQLSWLLLLLILTVFSLPIQNWLQSLYQQQPRNKVAALPCVGGRSVHSCIACTRRVEGHVRMACTQFGLKELLL